MSPNKNVYCILPFDSETSVEQKSQDLERENSALDREKIRINWCRFGHDRLNPTANRQAITARPAIVDSNSLSFLVE